MRNPVFWEAGRMPRSTGYQNGLVSGTRGKERGLPFCWWASRPVVPIVGCALPGSPWEGRVSRSRRNRLTSWRVIPVSARSAMISPITLANLLTVPGAGRSEGNLIVLRVHVYDEVVVRSVGEHAGLQVHRRAAAVREVTLREVPQEPLVVVVRLAVDSLGIDFLFQVVVLTELEARNTLHGEAVEAPLPPQQIEAGEGIGPEVLGAGRLHPGQDLPLGHRKPFEHVEQLAVPSTGGNDKVVRFVDAPVGANTPPPLLPAPLKNPVVGVDLGPPRLVGPHVGDDAL